MHDLDPIDDSDHLELEKGNLETIAEYASSKKKSQLIGIALPKDAKPIVGKDWWDVNQAAIQTKKMLGS